jgi:3-oxoacyl-[acyl-carrier protein] reductase
VNYLKLYHELNGDDERSAKREGHGMACPYCALVVKLRANSKKETVRNMADKVAVITGGAGGLGSALVRVFNEHAYRVVIHYHASDAAAAALAATLGDRALLERADVSSYAEVAAMADRVRRQWGRVDVLLNNAGITKDSLLVKLREEEWDRVLDVNIKGPFNAIRAFVPLMAGGGHIVNISSYSGLKGKEGQAAYSSSKAALLGLTKTAAAELAGEGIRVNAVLPGYLPTVMGEAAAAREKAKEESLLHTLSDTLEAARFVLWLVGTGNITGQVFCLDSRII